MKTKKIVYKRKDGVVLETFLGEFDDEVSIEDQINHVLEINDHDKKIPPILFDSLDVPTCKDDPYGELFEAWDFDNDKSPKKVVVNLNKAVDCRLTYLRNMRNRVLEVLDKDAIIALGKSNRDELIADIEDQKNALRDLPKTVLPSLKKCKNVQELLGVVPPELMY